MNRMSRTIDMDDLTPEFRQCCESWYAALPIGKRAAVDAWIAAHPLPEHAPVADRPIYAYCELPIEIDPWITCRTAASDVTPEWIAKRQPLVQILPSGDMLSQFRESELREIASA